MSAEELDQQRITIWMTISSVQNSLTPSPTASLLMPSHPNIWSPMRWVEERQEGGGLGEGGGGLTLPGEAPGRANVDVAARDAPGDAQVAHALQIHVEGGVAELVLVILPQVVGVVGQVVAPHVALAHHAPLLLAPSRVQLDVSMAACLGARGSIASQNVSPTWNNVGLWDS